MIIVGYRRDGAKELANYLLRRGKNEDIWVREIENYPSSQLDHKHLRDALRLMGIQANAKGNHRTLYHAVIALWDGETFNKDQLRIAADTLATSLGLSGHQRVIVEHKKNGRQHFHIVFNLINPKTGKLAPLLWPYIARRETAQQLAKKFGFAPIEPKDCWSIRRWEYERGKSSGIDPKKIREEVTAIYGRNITGKGFIEDLKGAGYILTKGRHKHFVIIDRAGDIHGLMRRIEGAKEADLLRKFPDLKTAILPSLEIIQKARKKGRPSRMIGKTIPFKRCATEIFNKARVRTGTQAHGVLTASGIGKTMHAKPLPNNRLAIPIINTMMRMPHARYRHTGHHIYIPPRRRHHEENIPDSEKYPIRHPEMTSEELLAWAFANRRFDILAEFGIYSSPHVSEPEA